MRRVHQLTDAEIKEDPRRLLTAWKEETPLLLLPHLAAGELEWAHRALEEAARNLSGACFGILTSGTTGEPKLVVGIRSRAESLAETLHVVQSNEECQSTVITLPLTYSFAFVNQWIWANVTGRQLVFTEGLTNPQSLLLALNSSRASMLCLVGAQIPLLARYLEGYSFPEVLRLHFAGGRFPAEHGAFIHRMFPNAAVYNNYGCTEALPRLTVRAGDTSLPAANIGRPIPGVRLRSKEGTNELEFLSDYRAMALGTERSLRYLSDDEWIPSGDLGQQEADGSWVLAGRSSEVFKRFGEKISLAQLTASVSEIWPNQVGFFLTKDRQGEEAHVLVLGGPAEPSDARRVLAELRRKFSSAHLPIRVETAIQLPLLPNGKLDTRALPSIETTQLWTSRL